MTEKAKTIEQYREFLQTKQQQQKPFGFDAVNINPMLFDFQKFCVEKGLKKGSFSFFEDCGLGKTPQQLEWADQVSKKTNAPILILAPLAVTGQTILEGLKFGYHVERLNTDRQENMLPGTYITNYDRLENINASLFGGVALDESSILKNFQGKMRNLIIEKFKRTQFKSCWTATPSPNDPMELGNHAEFMGVMTRNEMLSMYFVHDGGDTSEWRIKGHAEREFWKWVSTWALMINKPSDIGFPDEGYVLPDLHISENVIVTKKRNNGKLFNDEAVSATNFNRELKLTIIERMDQAASIVNNHGESCIVWVKQDAEADYIRQLLPAAVEVRGSQKQEIKESRLIGFGKGEFQTLITKTKIAQFGLNYQNCGLQVFTSPDFSFESIYQAIRRSWRFGRRMPVHVIIVSTDTIQNVVNTWNKKQKQFREMQTRMIAAMNENDESNDHGINSSTQQIIIPEFLKSA